MTETEPSNSLEIRRQNDRNPITADMGTLAVLVIAWALGWLFYNLTR